MPFIIAAMVVPAFALVPTLSLPARLFWLD
jgi:hypothetical protein